MTCQSVVQYLLALVLGAAALIGTPASADFRLIDNFETFVPANVDDQGEWNAAGSSSQIIVDPVNSANQVLAITAESTTAYRRNTQVFDGTVRMLFFRFRFASQISLSFGLSDAAAPSQFGHFEAEIGFANQSSDLRVRNGASNFDVLTTPNPNTWYNVWMLIDNVGDDTQIWLTEGTADATPADQLDNDLGSIEFDFRDIAAGDLRTFFIKTAGGNSDNSGPLLLDDIYLEDRDFLNLQNPYARADSDGDGVNDIADNCTLVFNPDQRDTNLDLLGNFCDADIAPSPINDCLVNFLDLQAMKAAFFSTPADPRWNPDADLDGDAVIAFGDLAVVKSSFFAVPGPSGLAGACN